MHISSTIAIATISLYFVRSGAININVGYARYVTERGYDWSMMASSQRNGAAAPSTYYLYFNVVNSGATGGPMYRWTGYPFRWLGWAYGGW